MVKRNYQVRSVTVEMPSMINDGLNSAAIKFNVCKSDIVRSVLYDFLVSSGVLPNNKEFDRQEDEYVGCVGRQSKILCLE